MTKAAACGSLLVLLLATPGAATSSVAPTLDGAAEPVWSPDSRSLAFVYRANALVGDAPERIDTIDPATGRRHAVVDPFPRGQKLYGLDWSPDGRRLLFTACCPAEVRVSGLDGGLPRVLAAGAWGGSWSPDGTEIAFLSSARQLEVMRADGSGRRALTPAGEDDLATFGRHPAWAPDGSRLAYVHRGDLFVYRFSDGSADRLTATARAENNPVWAPDGSLLAYTSGPDLMAVRPDGSAPRLLYDTKEEDDVGAAAPSWSPDSSRLVFGDYRLWIVARDGKERRRLIVRGFTGDRNASMPAWSPDGRRIAYVASRMCPGVLPDALGIASVSQRRARFLTADCVVRGTIRNDRLRGTSRAELLYGLAGDDAIFADGGSDVVQGGRGDDRLDAGRGPVSECGLTCETLRGGPGDDVLVAHEASSLLDGGLGDDRLVSGAGYDYVLGGRGVDLFRTGAGKDTIRARDGSRDRIRCGAGVDFVAADFEDVVARDCEHVTRRAH